MTEFLCLCTVLAALLLFAVLTSKGPSPDTEEGPSTAFSPKWLTPVRDDVPRLKIGQGLRGRPMQELLARWIRECDARFRDAPSRIRRV